MKESKASVPFLNMAESVGKVEKRMILKTKCRHCSVHCGCGVACIHLCFQLLRIYCAIIALGCGHDFIILQNLLCYGSSEWHAQSRIIHVQYITLRVLNYSASLSCLLINMDSSISRIHRGSQQTSNTCPLPSDESACHI